MVSVTIAAGEEQSVSLKTNGIQESNQPEDKNMTELTDEVPILDVNNGQKMVESGDDCPQNESNFTTKTPEKSQAKKAKKETSKNASPRKDLPTRTRRHPQKFKDFDNTVVRRSPKKNDGVKNVVSEMKENKKDFDNTAIRRSLEKKQPDGAKNAVSEKKKRTMSPAKKKLFSSESSLKNNNDSVGDMLPVASSNETKLCKDSVLNNITDSFDNQDVKSSNAQLYSEGSLLWAKIFAHPYWPCIITADPETQLYYKRIAMMGKKRMILTENDLPMSNEAYSYHVRFFGPKQERSWTNTKQIEIFESGDKYLANLEQMINDAKNESQRVSGNNKKKKVSNKVSAIIKQYGIKSQAREGWDVAVKEANKVLSLTVPQRLKKYGFQAQEATPEKPKPEPETESLPVKKKRKKASPEKTPPKKVKTEFTECTEFQSLADFRKHMKSDTSYTENSASSEQEDVYQFSVPKAKKVTKNFEVFAQKIRPKLKSTHKNIKETELQLLMEKLWNKMSSKQQLRYKSHKSRENDKPKSQKDSSTSPEGGSSHRKSAMKIKIGKFGKFEASLCSSISQEEASEEEVPVKEHIVDDNSGGTMSSTESVVSQDSSSDDQNGRKSKYIRKTKIPSIHLYEDQAGNGDQVCFKCEKPGQLLISCKGPCLELFHPACVVVTGEADDYMCPDCTAGDRTCFVCKEKSKDLVSCNISQCGKFYHSKCLKNYPSESMFKSSKGITCPLHACLSCVNDNVTAHLCKPPKNKLVRCIRCPIAYHKTETCVSAGCSLITQSIMICYAHFQPKKNNSHHARMNVNWCFICSDGGSLICCESCPAAFHADCLNIEAPAGSFYCDDCVDHRQPRYGNIVWVKLGSYRWWPAVICVPNILPKNIMTISHSVGEFPVRFFGSHDYFWLHRGRTFLFHEGDKGSTIRTQNHLVRVFNKAVSEATEAFKEWCTKQETKKAEVNEKLNQKPKYKHIKINRPYGKVTASTCTSEQPSCECSVDQEHPCGEYSSCINRMMMMECNPTACLAGDRCENQRFEKQLYPNIAPFRTGDKGWGLHCREDIKQGEFVTEYVGEIVDEEECKKRIKQMNIENNKKFYFLTLDKDRIIDAGPKGNEARFMNHSCQPNCETQKWTINGAVRVGLFALCDIPAYTELNFNYNLQCLGDEKIKCMCGAPNCSGYIGVPPKALPAIPVKKVKLKKRKIKKKKQQQHDDECFRCGDGGDLVLCDRKTCSKCYHLACLKLKSLPPGKWDCPWHHCDICGKSAVKLCSLCPNSFCRQHSAGTVKPSQDDNSKLICEDHEEFPRDG